MTGRVALITGGSRGLGLQIAEAYAELGAKLILTARKAEALEQTARRLRDQGADVHAIPSNLAEEGVPQGIVDEVMGRYGQIDILVNNAGATWGAPATEYPSHAWQKLIDVNLTGTFYLSQAVGNASMIPNRKGKIVTVASIAGLKGNNPRMMGTIGYNTTKGGLVNMTRALAAEWAQYNINVNAIAPGYFPTKMTRGTLAEKQAEIEAGNPLGRIGGPEDLKGVAVLLGSDAGNYITGQIVAVDGGVTAL